MDSVLSNRLEFSISRYITTSFSGTTLEKQHTHDPTNFSDCYVGKLLRITTDRNYFELLKKQSTTIKFPSSGYR